MVRLNSIGPILAGIEGVHAMTDVTGFGLLGHLSEMCAASRTMARVQMDRVPLIDAAVLDYYLAEGCIPGGTNRNFASYGSKILLQNDRQRNLLADPQTSGGLLISVSPAAANRFEDICAEQGYRMEPFGTMHPAQDGTLVEVM